MRGVPGLGRMRFLRPGSDALLGPLVDVFAAFAVVDQRFSDVDAEVVLDLLRSAFPEVDHGWLARRLQRSVRSPQPLTNLAAELYSRLDSQGKLALGMQLWILVAGAGKSQELRTTFDVFMRRLGCPEYGHAILREMDEGEPLEERPFFERVCFGREAYADVWMPDEAVGCAFRVYRVGDVVILRNTGAKALWVRGHSLESGEFLRVRLGQALVVPGWTLMHEDLVHFLNVKRTETLPRIYIAVSDEGLTVERNRTRKSVVTLRFGVEVEVEATQECELRVGKLALEVGKVVRCHHGEKLIDPNGATVHLEELRKLAIKTGRRFRIDSKRRRFRVSNDPSALGSGDLLISPGLAPRVVLEVRYLPEEGVGYVRVLEGTAEMDGERVGDEVCVEEGGMVRLSPRHSLRCFFSEPMIDEVRQVVETLEVDGVAHDFGAGARALDNLNFTVRRGEMMCVIGPSGSGKSTLLAAMSGQLEPLRGHVRMNGVSLYREREELVRFIARMPQEEALFPQLTVREHLRHAASIRRPSQKAAERERRIDVVLAELGLQGVAHRRVGAAGEKTLSGGERSRLNLGLDLLGAAEVYLFDEPISGLSSKDSEHVAETLRAMAMDKIVVCSLHRPGAKVLRLFDKVLLLDNGGRMAFFGSPWEMTEYFRNACEELGLSHPSLSASGPLGADFVFDVLETPLNTMGGVTNSMSARRFPPSFWQERYEGALLMRSLGTAGDGATGILSGEDAGNRTPFPKLRRRRMGQTFVLFAAHFQRSFFAKMRTRGTWYSILIEAPVLAALIGFTLRSSPEGPYEFVTALHLPAFLFLSATVAMFLGLTNAATEVLRDRSVLRRERNVQSGAALYVTAKLLTLIIVAAMQCAMYAIVAHPFLEIRDMFLQHWMWLTLTACTGSSMALLISSLVRTERAALTAVPLLLVPQMLLAGALVSFKEMNRALYDEAIISRERGGTPVPANVMPLRYAYEAMVVAQATKNPFEKERIRLQKRLDELTQLEELNKNQAERLEILKIALTKLLAAGARTPDEGHDLVERLSILARRGTRDDTKNLRVWPEEEDVDEVRAIADFYVNSRIDLLTREAETLRTDYRNDKKRAIFLALRQPVADLWVDTLKRNGVILGLFILVCPTAAAWFLKRQNRKVD